MDRSGQLIGQRRGYQSVPFKPIESAKGFSNNPHRKMALTAFSGARMTRMQMTFIRYLKRIRNERRLKLGSDPLLHVTHILSPFDDCRTNSHVSTCVLARSILECENFRLILGS